LPSKINLSRKKGLLDFNPTVRCNLETELPSSIGPQALLASFIANWKEELTNLGLEPSTPLARVTELLNLRGKQATNGKQVNSKAPETLFSFEGEIFKPLPEGADSAPSEAKDKDPEEEPTEHFQFQCEIQTEFSEINRAAELKYSLSTKIAPDDLTETFTEIGSRPGLPSLEEILEAESLDLHSVAMHIYFYRRSWVGASLGTSPKLMYELDWNHDRQDNGQGLFSIQLSDRSLRKKALPLKALSFFDKLDLSLKALGLKESISELAAKELNSL